jgi:formate/nitrite transporter FocA (FNT family)
VTDRQKILAATLAGFLIAYASSAFVQWDANAANCSGIARFLCVAFGFFVALICTIIALPGEDA